MTARPVFGVVACNRPFSGETAQVVIDRYVDAAMAHADAAAIIIPARPALIRPEEVAARIDGLMLTGSPSNVHPARYGRTDGDGPFDEERDAMSFALIELMAAAGKPVFGICRGFQEINVAFGGTLDGTLGDQARELPHHAPHGVTLGEMFGHRHPVALTPGGILSGAFGTDEIEVNSVHFQGVARLGAGLTVEARAPDGTIEAVSGRAGGAPVLAVQWHPEWDAAEQAPSRAFFALMGRALRGEPLIRDIVTEEEQS